MMLKRWLLILATTAGIVCISFVITDNNYVPITSQFKMIIARQFSFYVTIVSLAILAIMYVIEKCTK